MKEDGQGTVKMSFHAKRKFFLAKALAENQPQMPKSIQQPRKMSILKPEDLEVSSVIALIIRSLIYQLHNKYRIHNYRRMSIVIVLLLILQLIKKFLRKSRSLKLRYCSLHLFNQYRNIHPTYEII